MNSSYFNRKRYLKNAIKEFEEREAELDEQLRIYNAQNKKAHNSRDARRYRQVYETANLISMTNTLMHVLQDSRKFYRKLINKLVD